MAFEPQEYKITEVKECTDDVKVFRVKTDLNPSPGQFFEVSVLGFGECPLASCSFEKNYVDMLVRNAGNVTNEMFKLQKGDSVFLRGPYGNGYDLKVLEGKNLILIAGGTGLAPITSLIEYIEKYRKKFGKVEIYFAFRDEEKILLKERVERWGKKFKIIIFLGKRDAKKKYETGLIGSVLEKHKPSVKDTMAVMCGPEPMMLCATEALKKFGLAFEKMYWNMERRMECAIGSCGRCFIQDVYVCRDGPVFRYDFIKPRIENEAFVHAEIEGKK